jgi:hypothetical protein
MAVTKIADVVVPEIYTPYKQNVTEQKSELIQSGVVVRDESIDALLNGGGLTFHTPSWKDLDNDDENVSTDNDASSATPKKIGTLTEVSVRLSRNQSWSAMDLAADLAGSKPMTAIANRVGYYWTRRMQAMFIATMQGIFADNAAAPSGSEHVQNDLTNDVSGGSYSAGVTDFSAEAFIDTAVTMGDSAQALGMCFMHSIVYARAQKNNLIDFIPDATGRVEIPYFLGRRVIVDDGMPNPAASGAAQTSTGIYHTWLFGAGAVRYGVGTPETPFETDRLPLAGDGGGQEIMVDRVQWCLHPAGHAYVGTSPSGGPSNASTSNNLANAGSWQRVFPERKQIKIARLITRES